MDHGGRLLGTFVPTRRTQHSQPPTHAQTPQVTAGEQEGSRPPIASAAGPTHGAVDIGSPPTAQPTHDQTERLEQLLQELEAVASDLPEAALLAAGRRVAILVASRTSHGYAGDGASDDGTLVPTQLDYGELAVAGPTGGAADEDRRSETGSIGSLDGPAAAADDPDDAEHDAAGAHGGAPAVGSAVPELHCDPRYAGEGVGPQWYDEQLGVRRPDDPQYRGDLACAPCDDGDGESDDGGSDDGGADAVGRRDPRLTLTHKDSVGFAAHGRRMRCDYHDLRCGNARDCMATCMLHERRISHLVAERQAALRRRPGCDPDRREARHTLYKAVVAWQWADPLGAGVRVRLPRCVLYRIRRLFPHPDCSAGCDYLDGCERACHYTGFRTADESRAMREGRFDSVDISD